MQKNQVRWQCRRGMLELDMMLLKFFDNGFEYLAEPDQHLFVQFLQETDQTLYRWLMGQVVPADPKVALLVQNIRDFACKP